jgi:hypothetical protein
MRTLQLEAIRDRRIADKDLPAGSYRAITTIMI